MAEANEALILDLLAWIAAAPRSYAEVMEAWRTACPRLQIWEDAVERGLVARERGADGRQRVIVTPRGAALLPAAPAMRRAAE